MILQGGEEMSLCWRRAALLILFAAGFLFVCLQLPAIAGIPLGRSRVKIVQQNWQQLLAGLLAEGPALAFRRDGVDGDVAVRGGWPFVVDYELEKPGFLLLTIAVDKGENRSYRVPADGTAPAGSRRQRVIYLNDDLGDAIQAGNLSLRAYEGKGGDRPVPFQLYGLGAGNRAVGSMTIVDVTFSPMEIAVGHEQKAEYGFKVLRSFSQVRVQISRLTDPGGIPQRVWERVVKPTPGQDDKIHDAWDGRDLNRKVSKGLHTLQVTAWFGPFGDWNAAAPGTLVSVRP
jgi:hypothetical protein